MSIQAIITDFDGTLVDTFQANYNAYKKAFMTVGLNLSETQYQQAFGLRYDEFMDYMHIIDDNIRNTIREMKIEFYPLFFDLLKPNKPLIAFISSFHRQGGKTAIASTARKENLENALRYLRINGLFDVIFTGTHVQHGKPDPEIYLKTMEALQVSPKETLIFEDSNVGVLAAKASGACYLNITEFFFK